MSTPPPLDYVEGTPPPRGFLVGVLRMVRIVSILCALTFTGVGGMLAWHFFFFVKGIVEQPDVVVGRWQALMAEAHAPTPLWPEPAMPEAPAQATSEIPSVLTPEDQPSAPVTITPNDGNLSPMVGEDAAPAEGGQAVPTPVPGAKVTPPGEVTPPREVTPPIISEGLPTEKPLPPDRTQSVAPHDTAKLFLDFADTVLDRFETGQFSWLVGMGFLAIFCWVLGKVPAIIISTGAKVVVDLVNFDLRKS